MYEPNHEGSEEFVNEEGYKPRDEEILAKRPPHSKKRLEMIRKMIAEGIYPNEHCVDGTTEKIVDKETMPENP